MGLIISRRRKVISGVGATTGGSNAFPVSDGNSTIIFTGLNDEIDLTSQLANYDDNGPAGFTRIAPGRSGSGAALQINYRPATPGPTFGQFIPETQDLYASWWFKVTPNWLPFSDTTGSGFKWFTTKRGDLMPRYTHGVSRLLSGGPPGFVNTGWEFETHDQSSTLQSDPTSQNISKAIRFNTVNDGNWHQAGYHIKTSLFAYEQIWIDGTRLLDTRDGQPGIPVGGYDHDSRGITQFQFGDLVVDGIPADGTTGSVTLIANVNGYTWPGGNFITAGFKADGVITPVGFASNPSSSIISVTATDIVVANARGAEGSAAGRTLNVTYSGDITYDDIQIWHN